MINNNVTTNYTYNALNQLISTSNNQGTTQHFNYDKRGNLVQILENNTIKSKYEFGAINRLTKATNAMGHIASYDYNGFGFRVGKQVTDNLSPTKHISYVLDLTKQYHNLLQMSDSTQTQSYTWDNNVAFADGNAYLQDELGSPLRYIDNTGSTIDSYGYTEFGDDIYGNQGTMQPFGYTGYTADSVAGTYFAQAREYMPGVGRFISEDILQDNTNWYSYCDSNPVAFIDPSGNVACPLDGDEVETESGWDLFWRGIANGFVEPWSNLHDGVTGFLNNPLGTIETAATEKIDSVTSDPWGFAFGRLSDAFNFTMNNRSIGDMINPAPSRREMMELNINIFGNLFTGNPYAAGRLYGNMVGETSINASMMVVALGTGKAAKGIAGAVKKISVPRPVGAGVGNTARQVSRPLTANELRQVGTPSRSGGIREVTGTARDARTFFDNQVVSSTVREVSPGVFVGKNTSGVTFTFRVQSSALSGFAPTIDINGVSGLRKIKFVGG